MPSAAPSRTAWLTPFKTSEPLLRQNSPSEALSSPVHVDVGLRIDRHCPAAALLVSSVLDQETAPDGKYRLRGKRTRSGGGQKRACLLRETPLGWDGSSTASRRRPQEQ
jgi:hypothetical protein